MALLDSILGADSGDSGEAADVRTRRRKLAEAMLAQGQSSAPIGHWSQGLNRVLQSMLGAYQLRKADEADTAEATQARGLLASVLGGGGTGASASPNVGTASGTPAPVSPAMGAAAAAGREDQMPQSADVLDLIRKEEGFAPQAKWDYRQYSGGYGSKAAAGETFTRDKAEQYLQRDAAPVLDWVRRNAAGATTDQKRALVSFGYNLGTDDLDRLLPDIQAGNWSRVAERMKGFNKAGGEVLPGLVNRRAREAALIAGGQPSGGAMPVDPSERLRMQAAALMQNPRTAKIGEALLLKVAGKGIDGPAERGTTPHAMTDAQGNVTYGTIGKDGTWQPLKGAEGYKATPKTGTIDTGTEIITRDVYGNELSRTKKDVAGKERAEEIGKAQGQAAADLPRVESNASSILSMIDTLSSDPYLPRMVGPMDSRLPNLSGDAARVQSKVDQIGGQAFLQAFSALKGAGQITETEGAKATAALSRLQSMGVNDADYPAALNDFRGEVNRLVEVARAKAGKGSNPDQPRAVKTLRFNPQTGELE